MVIDSSVEIKEDATPLAVTTTTTAGNSLSSSNFNAESFWQHIIALDVQFSSARCFGSYLKMLYIKRRNQLFRDLSRTELNAFRRRYIKLRYNILSQKYNSSQSAGDSCQQQNASKTPGRMTAHIRNSSDSSFLSFIYDDLISSSADELQQHQEQPSTEITITPNDDDDDDHLRVPPNYGDHHHHLLLPPCVTPQSIAFCENFSFSGMLNHIFDQHSDSVSSIKFANRHKSLLAAASADGTLSIAQLTPSPPTILFILRGHKAAITGFEWSASNDLLVSCSADATLRLWSTMNGSCLRVFHEPGTSSAAASPLTACALCPSNNNIIVTGNAAGVLNVLNLSTGIYSKNALTACETGPVTAMCFQSKLFVGGEGGGGGGSSTSTSSCESSEDVLWVGDGKGYIAAYRLASFETTHSARLLPLKKVMVVAGCPVTSLSAIARNLSGGGGKHEALLLANIACNAVVLFRCPSFGVGGGGGGGGTAAATAGNGSGSGGNSNTTSFSPNSNSLEFIKSFPVRHQNASLAIRSSFCPASSSKTADSSSVCIVTGSEDTCVYFYTFDTEQGRSDNQDNSSKSGKKARCVNKLQGHSSPVLDVCFNYEESLLASADSRGNIIIWKRESLLAAN